MTSEEVQSLVSAQMISFNDATECHGVRVKQGLITPIKTRMTKTLVRDGKRKKLKIDVWIVFREKLTGEGYVIFYDEGMGTFGIAYCDSGNLESGSIPDICGYYGDFMTTFLGM